MRYFYYTEFAADLQPLFYEFFVLKFCKECNGENPFFTAAADGAADLIGESPNALHAQPVVFAPLAFG